MRLPLGLPQLRHLPQHLALPLLLASLRPRLGLAQLRQQPQHLALPLLFLSLRTRMGLPRLPEHLDAQRSKARVLIHGSGQKKILPN